MLFSKPGRFIICTSCKAGNQKGCSQGEKSKNKRNLQNHLETKSHYKNNLSHFSFLNTHLLFWVGVFVAVFGLCLFVDTPDAKAASLGTNIAVARQAIENVAPVISNNSIDSHSAALVFTPDGYLNKPLLAETKITQTPKIVSKKLTSLNTNVVLSQKAAGNHFAYGWCTYYVASRRNVPWFGNAGTWLTGARKFGFATGNNPQTGAIIVTSESRWGHVGIIESVNGDGTITISEMNYSGFGRISSRTISTSYGAIKGYIY